MPTENKLALHTPIHVYYFYISNKEDEPLFQGLLRHLNLFERIGRTESWYPDKGLAGTEPAHERRNHLLQAQVILLLVSVDFSGFREEYKNELSLALERHAQEKAFVVPILLRPGLYRDAPFAHLTMLPDNGIALTKWTNLDEGFTNVARGLASILDYLASGITPTPTPLQPRGELPALTAELSYRQHLLTFVRNSWIKNFFERVLTPTNMIELELHEDPAALANPLQNIMLEPSLPLRPIQLGTPINTVYDNAQGQLLILGEAGAGKTTLLLHLARILLARAEQSDQHSLPAIFHLSTWNRPGLPFQAWLLAELQNNYHIPHTIGEEWISKRQLILLLDGLDELAPGNYESCIQALNMYQLHTAHMPLVVCSRKTPYFAQENRLTLHKAVLIQPLTPEQVESYVRGTADPAALRTFLKEHAPLRILAQTPLWLTLLSQIYRDKAETDSLNPATSDQPLEQRIFELYFESVLKRDSLPPFSHADIEHWLGWLAWQMQNHHLRSFYLERIQPDWLEGDWQLILYYMCNAGIGMLIIAPLLGLLLASVPTWGAIVVLLGTLGGGAGFAFGSAKIRPIEVSGRGGARSNTRSLLYSFGLWLFVLLHSQGGSNVLDTIIMLVVALSLLPLLIAEQLKKRDPALLPASALVIPDEGLRRSRQNGIRVGLFCASVLTLLVLLLQLIGSLKGPLSGYYVIALLMALLCGLLSGGLAALQLTLLRWLLRTKGVVPRAYVRFLDEATKRQLLHKIGGGYLFFHPLLQDYFAARYEERYHHKKAPPV